MVSYPRFLTLEGFVPVSREVFELFKRVGIVLCQVVPETVNGKLVSGEDAMETHAKTVSFAKSLDATGTRNQDVLLG